MPKSSPRKRAVPKLGGAPAAPSDGPYSIVRMTDLVPHLVSADHIRIALLDDAHASESEVAATSEVLCASWELWRLVTKFVANVDAVRASVPDYLREEWPDLNDNYNTAITLLRRMSKHACADIDS